RDEIESLICLIPQRASRHLFTGIGLQLGFIIERVDVRKAAGEEDENQVLRLCGKMRRLRSERTSAVQLGGHGKCGEQTHAACSATFQETTTKQHMFKSRYSRPQSR